MRGLTQRISRTEVLVATSTGKDVIPVGVKVVLADWKVKTPCHADGVFINKMLSLNRFFFKFISKRHYLLAHYIIVTFRSLIVMHKKAEPSCASHVVTFRTSRYVTSM